MSDFNSALLNVERAMHLANVYANAKANNATNPSKYYYEDVSKAEQALREFLGEVVRVSHE